MTIQDAIKYWEHFLEEIPMIDDSCGWSELERLKQADATNMAISALCAMLAAKSKPQTNGDHIRAMTDEELAKLVPDWSYTAACNANNICYHECEKCTLNWLKQPYEGGEDDGKTD
jgi:hypothetical protein